MNLTDDDKYWFEWLKAKDPSIANVSLDDCINDCAHGWEEAYMLGHFGDNKAIEPLIKAIEYNFKENEIGVIANNLAISFSLGKLKSKTAVDALIVLMETSLYHTRWMAAWALGEIGDKKAIVHLEKIIGDDEYDKWFSLGAPLIDDGYLDSDADEDDDEYIYNEEVDDYELLVKFIEYIELEYIYKEKSVSPLEIAIKKLS